MRNKRKSIIFAITLIVLCFGIGYAYLTTTLSINGVTDIDSNNWDIYFDNVQVTDGSVTGDQVTQAPTIDNTTKTTVSFHVRLKEPGEFYEFTVDAKNDGTIDAMIELLAKTVNNSTTIPSYLNYSVTYGLGSPIEQKQVLRANRQVTYKVRVEYRTDINPEDLPSTAQSLNLSFGVEYVQKDSTAVENLQYAYIYGFSTGYGTPFIIQNPSFQRYYYFSVEDYYNDPTSPIIGVKIIGENDIFIDSEIMFKVNGNVYFLKPGGATYNSAIEDTNGDSIYFEDNIDILNNALGAENCTMSQTSNGRKYACEYENADLVVTLYENGDIHIFVWNTIVCGAYWYGAGCGG